MRATCPVHVISVDLLCLTNQSTRRLNPKVHHQIRHPRENLKSYIIRIIFMTRHIYTYSLHWYFLLRIYCIRKQSEVFVNWSVWVSRDTCWRILLILMWHRFICEWIQENRDGYWFHENTDLRTTCPN
jgi:hypothetical protein